MTKDRRNGPREPTPQKAQKNQGKIDYAKEAAAARVQHRANNSMPQGTQVQHWTKERLAKQSGMAPETMNKNLSPLQSRNANKATTLLTDPKGGGTRYSVKGGSRYGNEHKFADRHMIPVEHERLKNANPNVDPKVAAEAAGAVARWKMTGDPGNVSKQLVEKVDIGKNEKFRPDAPSGKSGQAAKQAKNQGEQRPQGATQVTRQKTKSAEPSGDLKERSKPPSREKAEAPRDAKPGQATAGKAGVVQKEPAGGPNAGPAGGTAPVQPPVIPPIIDIPPGGQAN